MSCILEDISIEPNTIDYSEAESVDLYEFPIESNWITSYKNFILTYCGNRIKIFEFNSRMALSLKKSYEMSFLLFFSRYLSKDAIQISCKVFLDLVTKGVEFKKAEDILCKIMRRIKIQSIKTARILENEVMVEYDDGSIVYYDSKLETLLQKNNAEPPAENPLYIKRGKDSVEIRFKDQVLFKEKLGHVKQVDVCGNVIFLRKSTKILAVVIK